MSKKTKLFVKRNKKGKLVAKIHKKEKVGARIEDLDKLELCQHTKTCPCCIEEQEINQAIQRMKE